MASLVLPASGWHAASYWWLFDRGRASMGRGTILLGHLYKRGVFPPCEVVAAALDHNTTVLIIS